MSVRCPASRHSTHRQASRAQSPDTTVPPETPPRLGGDGRCCGASSPVRPAANDARRTVSLLSRPYELFQSALNARDLFARAEASPPLGPLLQPLLMFTCA